MNNAQAEAGNKPTPNGNKRKNPKTFPSQQATAHQSRRESPRTRGGISHPLGPPSALPPSPAPRPHAPLRFRPRPLTQIRRPRPWRRAGECSSRSSSSATAGAAGSLSLSIPDLFLFCFSFLFCSFVCLLACAGSSLTPWCVSLFAGSARPR
jgi:hypothetical protein